MQLFILIKISLMFVAMAPVNNIGSHNGLSLSRQQAIIWNKDDLVYPRIYALLCITGP